MVHPKKDILVIVSEVSTKFSFCAAMAARRYTAVTVGFISAIAYNTLTHL
jgi:hypothetical protein